MTGKNPTLKERVERLEQEAGIIKDGLTRIFFLLDRSGSMNIIKEDTIGGFNSYLDAVSEDGAGEIRFTMAQFDDMGFDIMSEDVLLRDATRLTSENYKPRASTPLIDSAMRLIGIAEDAANEGDKVIIVIQTDGNENSSQKFKNNDLKAKVETIQGKGWAVNFIGAGINAYSQAQQYGIAAGSTMSYGMGDTKRAFAATARSSASYSLTGALQDSHFTDDEKKESGDKFQPGKAKKPKKSGSGTSPS